MKENPCHKSGADTMKDIQNLSDTRGIDIQKVGVTDVHLPFLIREKSGGFQSVLANIQVTVSLPNQYKGTHMSRFVEVLNEWRQKAVSLREIRLILEDIIQRLDAREGHLEIAFKYFIEKEAPVSHLKSVLDYDIVFSGNLTAAGKFDAILSVTVPFTSLCPCSKAISDGGAHNQRSMMKASVRFVPPQFEWIEDLVHVMESQASSPVYSLLKREDEKYVTEAAYNNPKFVEDTIRDLVLAFRKIKSIRWFDVECKNFESIHNHNAYARHSEYTQPAGEK
jgi:GTP cyclohydrolase I